MKSFLIRFKMILFLSLIWCLLNEKFDTNTFFIGIVVAIITFFVLKLIQPQNQTIYSYNISIISLIKFTFVLIKNIYKSTYETIVHILKDEINPQFVSVSTKIKTPWLQALIGNAITLTPGTVTIHLLQGKYIVLWLYPPIPKKYSKNMITNLDKTWENDQFDKILVNEFETILIREEKNA